MDLPTVKNTDDMGEHGVGLVTEAVRRAGHIFRPNERRDFGIDGQIEIVDQGRVNRHAMGRLIAVQIKCGPSYLKNDIGHAYVHYCSTIHANYWEGHSLPVIVALCDPNTAECYWSVVDSASLVRTPEGAKVTVPKANKLRDSESALREIAQNGKSKLSLPRARSFVFPLNKEYGFSLDEEELGALCGEVSLAYKNGESVVIEINFEIEDWVADEAGVIRASSVPTVEQRKRLIELEAMREWFSEKKEAVGKGNSDPTKGGFCSLGLHRFG